MRNIITKAEITLDTREIAVLAIPPGRFSRILNWDDKSIGLVPSILMLLRVLGNVWTNPAVCSTKIGTIPATAKEITAKIII